MLVLNLINPANVIGKIFWVALLIAVAFNSFVPTQDVGVTKPISPVIDSSTVVIDSVELGWYNPTVDQIRIIEIYTGHAWDNHGTDVNKAIKCLSDNGTMKSFKTFGFFEGSKEVKTNLWLCFDGKDYYSVITTIFEKIAGGNHVAKLVTAYKVAKEVFPTLDDYLKYIAVKWGAVEINYVIKAGEQFFLSPK